MSAEALLSRELKSLQEKLATAQRQGPVKSAKRRAGPAVYTATGPAPATVGQVAPTGRLPARIVSTVVLAAALICVALPMAISALSGGGLFIVSAHNARADVSPPMVAPTSAAKAEMTGAFMRAMTPFSAGLQSQPTKFSE
jgi:hypothetical protein